MELCKAGRSSTGVALIKKLLNIKVAPLKEYLRIKKRFIQLDTMLRANSPCRIIK